ncbi:uncharacterized protein C1orf198 homolog isoform X2 [Lampris incognitus]|uniref:uncharacterized protein C1orf198 homolog isoform X2 n=1 Tax=Lampris incognitus TaxID=2546036 RepID=UPI0024B50352|nr:uncharacterized protein C1orf198 homolog isoform X2 [Lampris incognitus]
MAAATMAGPDAHRLEEKKLEYFSSINSMAKKIMLEREKIKAKHGPGWEKMTPGEQDSAIDSWMMDPHIRARYAMHRVERDEVVCYPKLLLQTGQKVVHFGDEDITWQDEHSAPFSWETKASGGDSLGRRVEESSSFWKISAERSRLEGEKADFQSLTPSQIKSLEKGEKTLPSYLRQDISITTTTKEAEATEPNPPAPCRSTKLRAPKPPAPPPPIPVAVTATPAAISITPSPAPVVSPAVGGWERAQSTLPSVSNTLDEMFSSNLMSKSSTLPASLEKEKDEEDSSSPAFSQFNTSSSILKTGFDFLDNW